MNDPPFQCPGIVDQDIRWASQLLGLPDEAFMGADGKDQRREVMKSMTTLDVAACPGSGKTTLLVAKLAVLAQNGPTADEEYAFSPTQTPHDGKWNSDWAGPPWGDHYLRTLTSLGRFTVL